MSSVPKNKVENSADMTASVIRQINKVIYIQLTSCENIGSRL